MVMPSESLGGAVWLFVQTAFVFAGEVYAAGWGVCVVAGFAVMGSGEVYQAV